MGKLGKVITILTIGIVDGEDWGDYFTESVDVAVGTENDNTPLVTMSRGAMILNFLIVLVIIIIILVALNQPDCTGHGIDLCTY